MVYFINRFINYKQKNNGGEKTHREREHRADYGYDLTYERPLYRQQQEYAYVGLPGGSCGDNCMDNAGNHSQWGI